jgi:hypothetical protein
MRIAYYIVFDPRQQVHQQTLTCHELRGLDYVACSTELIEPVELGLRLWEGTYEDMHATWLRWCDREGNLIPTGAEWRQRADQEQQRADQEQQRAERLAMRLRAMGINPDEMDD